MSDSNQSWFHCGRCGELFLSEPGNIDGRLCAKCGFDPSTGAPASDTKTPAKATVIPPAKTATPASENSAGHSGKRTVKKRKNRHLMLKLVGGWVALLALIVGGAKFLWPDNQNSYGDTQLEADKAATINREDDNRQLNEALPGCAKTFSSFLAAGGFEERSQFVLNPVTATSRMVRFYSQNPLTSLDPETLQSSAKELIRLPDQTKVINTQWTTPDGKTIEGSFQQQQGEWLLDWEHFARYSDYPWALFLAGSGPAEGEFRLLARERLAEERKASPTISLVLYAPRFGKPLDPGFQSPEFLVSRNHRNGKILDAAFKQMREGNAVFNSSLPNPNPDGMIRVRVKVRRVDDNQLRSFEITDVIACHWMSVDETGVPLDQQSPENTGNQDL